MWHAVPVEHLLLLLSSDAVVLVQEVEEWALGLFQRSVCSGLQVSQVGEDTLFKLLGVLDRSAKSLESEGETSYDVCSGDVEKIVPQYTGDVLAGREEESTDVLIGLPVDWRGDKEIFH